MRVVGDGLAELVVLRFTVGSGRHILKGVAEVADASRRVMHCQRVVFADLHVGQIVVHCFRHDFVVGVVTHIHVIVQVHCLYLAILWLSSVVPPS